MGRLQDMYTCLCLSVHLLIVLIVPHLGVGQERAHSMFLETITQLLGWVSSLLKPDGYTVSLFVPTQAAMRAREADVPGWGQDQHRRAIRTRRRTVPGLAQPLGARQQVPQGFAAAGLRDRLHVPPRQARRPAPATGRLVISAEQR